MDPATAILNCISAIATLVGKIIDKAPAEDVGAIILKHEARIDTLWTILAKVNSTLGKLFADFKPTTPAN